ncbi:MAG: bifunctional acetate--CoA ligase family protein/GNAT family N-acetyltransferase [Phycisphaerales bacterium]|nr:bifunctional acetate--CoA ligase family protein/GNAT family N-acetyltransferase [Phycisphaerales bacterium]
MSIQNLDRILAPRRIAVLGASHRVGSVGNAVFTNLLTSGFQGVVYPINPKHESVGGVQAYRDIASVPHTPDLAVICTPARTVPGLVREAGEAGVRGLLVLSAGFGEGAGSGANLREELRGAMSDYPGMRMIGPNCLGVMVPGLGMNATFGRGTAQEGGIAFISQSGALCTSVLDWALDAGVGFSYFVSVGNVLDVTFGDLIDYVAQDPMTKSIILYIESLREARGFLSAARAFARTKPIIAYKAGRFAESAKAASSHTGAMAGEDAVYDAAFRRAGIERVYEIADMFECASLLRRGRRPSGDRLAIVTNAGGPGVIATDALLARDGRLAVLADETMSELNGFLPADWSHGNPVDILGDAPAERYAQACQTVLSDKGVDAVLAVLSPQAMTSPTDVARALIAVAAKSRKPVLASWMGGPSVREGASLLEQAQIPTYRSPDDAVQAFMHLVKYSRNLEVLFDTPRDIPVELGSSPELRLRAIEPGVAEDGMLTEHEAKAVLSRYGFDVAEAVPAASAAKAIEAAERIGYPVVLKLNSPDITHKGDVGGVKLNLRSPDAVRDAYADIVARAVKERPEARIEGVMVQPMLDTAAGVELIIGAKRDPVFGVVMLVGAGGTLAELLADRVVELPPLNERLVRRMLESLRCWPLLRGYRDSPAVNLDALVSAIERVSYLLSDHPEIAELDINPLLATPERVIALDARIRIEAMETKGEPGTYEHLAIRPYPAGLEHQAILTDGSSVLLRPIRPEDEPMWHDMVAACSEQSMHFRFGAVVDPMSHGLASRFCFIDYDREMAIVAEVGTGPERRLAGVGRMVGAAGLDDAEFAILVADPWQGQGLGRLLTERCLDVARIMQTRRLTAEMDAENSKVVDLLRSVGFQFLDTNPGERLAAELALGSARPGPESSLS